LALLYVKGNPVAFVKGLETGCIDSGVMNEYIRTIFLLDEAVTLAAVKPFNYSISHVDILLSKKILIVPYFRCQMTDGAFL
jgi:hypothetical protein